MTRSKWLEITRLVGVILIVSVLALFYIFKWADHYPADQALQHRPGFFGVTFSTKFAESIDLDWRETYDAIIQDLQVKHVRIPVYWDEIESTEGQYDFSRYDYMISAGAKQGVQFVISIGRRVPRWPECHSPSWLNKKSATEIDALTLKTVQAIVERYRGEASVEYWQVENEPFLGSFGVCPPLDEDFLRQELDLVRSLDSRQIIVTASGEIGSWRREARLGDIFGSTLYRVVYSSWLGYIRYPWPPSLYRLKAKVAGLASERLMVMELQAEPWVPLGKMSYLSAEEINKTMSLRQFKANLQYAINLDFRRTYAWGVEWWYWQKKYGNPEYWRIAAGLFP